MERATFRLEHFEGPLALLLHLIDKHEIDIYEIPVAELTDQYLAVVNAEPGGYADMDGMSEFLVMAATLLEIKSRMLLPKPPAPAGEAAEDPRDALVRKLLEYKQAQDFAGRLKALAPEGDRFVREAGWTRLDAAPAESADRARLIKNALEPVSLDDLRRLFADVVLRREQRIDPVRARYGNMTRSRYTVEDKIRLIESWLKKKTPFLFSELAGLCVSHAERLTVFLALLETIRCGRVRVKQTRIFSDIICESQI